MSFFLALRRGLQILRQDVFIAVPYLLFTLLTGLVLELITPIFEPLLQNIGKRSPQDLAAIARVLQDNLWPLIFFVGAGWLVKIFVDGLTYIMADEISRDGKFNFVDSSKKAVSRFLPLVFTTLIITLISWLVPLVLAVLFMSSQALGSIVPLMAFTAFNFLFLFCPVAAAVEKAGPWKAFTEGVRLIKSYFWFNLSFAASFMFCLLFAVWIVALLIPISPAGGPVLAALGRGFGELMAKLVLFVYYKDFLTWRGKGLVV